MRNTRQKDAIREVFARSERPLGPSEIAVLAQRSVPALGIATVYRALRELCDQGWIVPVSVAGGTRYERADRGHHHHFHCQTCDRAFDIDGCVGDLGALAPKGFRVTGHELTLSGICDACASRGPD